MKKNTIIISGLLFVVVGMLFFILIQDGYLPLEKLLSADRTQPPGTSPVVTQGAVAADEGGSGADSGTMDLELDHIRSLLVNVNAEQKQALLDDVESFREFVRQEALNQSLLAAARSNGLQDETDVQFLMERNANNVLREVYLNRLLMNNMPSDFPSEEQLRQFFEENREDMVLAEQVPVWQIFLQVREGMDDTEISALAAEVERISQEIRDNALDFATAAEQYSQHQPSQGNGGYMGLLKVSDLVPGISETLLNLDEGVVSSPLRTEMGFHILMRGKITPARELGYEQAREQIHNHLVNQAQNRIRNQVTQKVQESFPVEVEETEIDAWRNSLRSALP